MTVRTKFQNLIMEITVLKRNNILKGVHLLIISEWLEFLFKTNSNGRNSQFSSFEINIHVNKNILASQRTSKNFCPYDIFRKEFNSNWFLSNPLCRKDFVICSFEILLTRYLSVRRKILWINHSFVGSSIHRLNKKYATNILKIISNY